MRSTAPNRGRRLRRIWIFRLGLPTLVGGMVVLSASPPAAAACALTLPGGECDQVSNCFFNGPAGVCRNGGNCTFNMGTCDGGSCFSNFGTCGEGCSLPVNTGIC